MKEQLNILTGDRPTGKLHIGHFVGSLRERVKIQDKGGYDNLFVMIADAQALTDNAGNPQKVRDYARLFECWFRPKENNIFYSISY